MTTGPHDVLGTLTGGSPRNLLENLARVGATLAKHERARPEIELFLASGQGVKGRIISVADDRGNAIVLVWVGGTPAAPAVTFVRVDQIAAITVADASLLVKAPLADGPVPSKLELQRQAAARSDGLTGAFGRAFVVSIVGEVGGATELDDDGRRAIGVAMPIIADVLTAIAGDDMGREALKALEGVELGSAATSEVRLDGKRLVIRAPQLLADQLTHAALRKAIEQLL